jgi:hypothetical protein
LGLLRALQARRPQVAAQMRGRGGR